MIKNIPHKQKVKEIEEALKYRDGDYYVGSMQECSVVVALGGVYGDDDVLNLLHGASVKRVDAAHLILIRNIERMKAHPMVKCKSCGSMVAEKISRDHTIKPQPNKQGDHVVTLTAGNLESLLNGVTTVVERGDGEPVILTVEEKVVPIQIRLCRDYNFNKGEKK